MLPTIIETLESCRKIRVARMGKGPTRTTFCMAIRIICRSGVS